MRSDTMSAPRKPLGRPSIILAITALQILGDRCAGLHLTNMTAPALQDPRKDMELHCRFDMGGEELYAVKWYKDDQEFLRYTPSASEPITQYPVVGVSVEEQRTRCMPDGCDLLLTQLVRPQSSGAYRCEISTEAPAFRLASQTHNVTVAAVPEERPRMQGLKDLYYLGDLLEAQCTSGLGDPKPLLHWYVNKEQVPAKPIREPSPVQYKETLDGRVNLTSTTIHLKLRLDKKLTQNQAKTTLEIRCVSSTEGINPAVALPLTSTKRVVVIDQNQLVNNQKLHSPFSAASRNKGVVLLLIFSGVARWC